MIAAIQNIRNQAARLLAAVEAGGFAYPSELRDIALSIERSVEQLDVNKDGVVDEDDLDLIRLGSDFA